MDERIELIQQAAKRSTTTAGISDYKLSYFSLGDGEEWLGKERMLFLLREKKSNLNLKNIVKWV